ncbi:hypothetical protein HAX54_020191 [Datura stramonium]|uniref:Transcriptional coactivator p15 (PC4) C-terminal domain-containing protein n=1 Tax=Datura stramonium TaxID=4076 RepID=A0ABS8UTG2_DATST|nr:hypothetical protein [Datura stramonium]
MSRRFGKRKEEDEYASEGDNPPKKSSRTDDSDDADGIVVCEISKNRRVSVRNFGGKIMVDIREFYLKDGNQMPGKKEGGLEEADRRAATGRRQTEEEPKSSEETGGLTVWSLVSGLWRLEQWRVETEMRELEKTKKRKMAMATE